MLCHHEIVDFGDTLWALFYNRLTRVLHGDDNAVKYGHGLSQTNTREE